MRALLLTLLFLNLAYFGYTRLAGEANEPAGATDAGPPVPRLALVGEGAPAPARCSTVGPFTTQVGAQRAATWLTGAHLGTRLHAADAPGPASYWVAVTTKTLQDATKIGLRLRAAGVADLVIMPPEAGGTDAIVSLGIYSERERAEHRVADLRHYAVSPAIIEQPHTVTTWWLDVQIAASEKSPDVNAIAQAAGEAGSLRMVSCPVTPAPAAATGAVSPTATPTATPPATSAPDEGATNAPAAAAPQPPASAPKVPPAKA